MASYQDVRGELEILTRDALTAGGATLVSFDGFQQQAPDALWAAIDLTFRGAMEPAIGCNAQEAISGTIIVTIAAPRQQGRKAAEDCAAAVLAAWSQVRTFTSTNRLSMANVEGPVDVTRPMDTAAYVTLNATFRASPIA